jgi:galactokinase
MQRSTEIALKAMKKQLRMRNILEEAEKVPGVLEFLSGRIVGRSNSRLKILGQVMNYQHSLLRDLYDVSLPELEKIKDAMLKNGAYGAKISGAGLGGSLIGLVDDNKSGQRTLNAALEAGAKQGWVSSVDEGARIENANSSKIRKIIKLESN